MFIAAGKWPKMNNEGRPGPVGNHIKALSLMAGMHHEAVTRG